MKNKVEIFWKDYEKVTVLEFDVYEFIEDHKKIMLYKRTKDDSLLSTQFSELIALINLDHVLYFKIIENGKENEKKEGKSLKGAQYY